MIFSPQDPQQVGDAEAGGDGVLPGGERRLGVRGQEVDHQPSLRLPRHHKLGEWKNQPHIKFINHSQPNGAEICPHGVKMSISHG